mgnify:CR=1 FL=1
MNRQTVNVLNAPIDVISWNTSISKINRWAKAHESRYVCICNVHSVVTVGQNPEFGRVVVEADMATADGAPVAWLIRKYGFIEQQRINGPDLMWKYCSQATEADVSIFLYGGTPEALEILQQKLGVSFPNLKIAGAYSPPFRSLTPEEDDDIVKSINESGAGVVWVSLGCPKQEVWMAEHRGKINAVMIGVGAAFDYHAGLISRAPVWMRNSGLEWLHRLCSEPRRLWKRYLVTNTIFVASVIRQYLVNGFKF